MNPTRDLHELGQRLWLDNITRDMLDQGTLARYIDEFSITGLTSNPTIFAAAIAGSRAYDTTLRDSAHAGHTAEALFMELALEDLRRAADLFRPMFDASSGADGWVSMEVSPLLASDTEGTIAAAAAIHRRASRPNLFVKIPGTPEGVAAIEETIFAGIPVNVTLLFSADQYLAAADAWLRGIERRIEAGLAPHVESVASLFISRWDAAVADAVPEALRNRLGIAMAGRALKAHDALLQTPRWRRVIDAGVRPQRLLWASTGTKDPSAPDTLYVEALAEPDTVNTLPEKTLLAFADHGRAGEPMRAGAGREGDCEAMLTRFAEAGVDISAVATHLQEAGAQSFVKSWQELLQTIAAKRVSA